MVIRRVTPLALVALLAAGAAGAKDRDNHHDRGDAQALAHATVTLQQAIGTAETQTIGRAVSADLSEDNGAPRIAVEIAGPQGVTTVLVDGRSGLITGTRDAEKDDDEDND